MARFLTTKGALAQIETVISTARRELHLISPFVQLTDAHARRLIDADARAIQISLVCRYDALKADERAFFAGLGNARVLDDPDLHAKCFINERGLVLTSLNLYGASEKNNEMGVWLDVEEDTEAYQAALLEARSIRDYATEVARVEAIQGEVRAFGAGPIQRSRSSRRANGQGSDGRLPAKTSQAQPLQVHTSEGVCIRCGGSVVYDPSRPYCRGCYSEWKEWANPLYEDRHCHSCGRANGGYTMEKPECYACYKENAGAAHSGIHQIVRPSR